MDILNILRNRLEIVDDSVSSKQLVNQLVSTGPLEEPLHLTELDNVVKRHYDWLRYLPLVLPFYTVRSNDDARIVGTTVLLDCGYVCASKREILQVLEFAVDPGWVILNNPDKSADLLKFARRKRIKLVFDSEAELKKIHKYYPEADILLRFFLSSKQTGQIDGCDADNEVAANELLSQAKDLDLNVIGWCFNAGANCTDHSIYYDALHKGREITDFALILGFDFTLIDLGGGFCTEKDTGIEQYAVYINKGLEEFFPDRRGLAIIAEPGHFHCAAAVTAVSAIHGKRIFWHQEFPSQIDNVFYYLNDRIQGPFGLDNLSNRSVRPIVWKQQDECGTECNTTLYGPASDGDVAFAKGVLLPELNVSDFLVFENQGAYSRVSTRELHAGCFPINMVVIRRSMWKFLQLLSQSQYPRHFLLSSKYLHKVWKIEALDYEW